MRALVVYESMYGNTRVIASNVADGLRAGYEVALVLVAGATDGRLDGFPADAGLYYEMASRLPHQAVLTGSGTMLAAAAGQGVDLSEEDPEPLPGLAAAEPAAAGDPRPLLVIVDGQGRVTRHAWLREQPEWARCAPWSGANDPGIRAVRPGSSCPLRGRL